MLKRGKGSDQEIEEYRTLLETPTEYEDGFTIRTILGVLFVSVIMVPGNMYLELMIGGSLGAAAQWVTIILFLEVAKRSFTTLSRQEVYVLYYVTISLVIAETQTFEGLLWNQYLVQSPAAKQFGVARLIPDWVAPQPESPAIVNRTFLHRDWLLPITLLVAGMVIGRISWFTMGYSLFRLTSDVERLPFPFAPIAAQGAMALAESSRGEESWRWRVFSTGSMIGLAFGLIYVGIPAISGAMLAKPIQLIPIPFVDLTHITGNFLPATPLGFTMHLGPIFAGLLMPFWAVLGGFIGVMAHTIANPLLHQYGYLPAWRQGMDAIRTQIVNSVDFWLSFGLGITLAVAVFGLYQVVSGLRRSRGERTEQRRITAPPPGRGDFPMWLFLLLFMIAHGSLVIIAKILFPALSTRLLLFFIFFALIYTPVMSFVNARLIGFAGQSFSLPYVREATIILSGYRGVDIWFIPFPRHNYGAQAAKFREIELTGTKFTSILRAEIFMVPVILVTSFMYWSYIWKLAPIPSASYPYAQMMWPLRAYQQCIFLTGTFRGEIEDKPEETSVSWSPPNLRGGRWWYWRARATDDLHIEDFKKREYGPWTKTGYFYTDFEGEGPPEYPFKDIPKEEETAAPLQDTPTAPALLWPTDKVAVDNPTPKLTIERAIDPEGDELEYYFEIDQSPTFDSPYRLASTDVNWLFKALKPRIIGWGFTIGLGSFIVLSALGLPILFMFGYVRALTNIPHFFIPEVVGAFLARYYFWKKYGRQQWRLYAAVLSVGFAVGMSLVGMAAAGIVLIQKSVSVLIF